MTHYEIAAWHKNGQRFLIGFSGRKSMIGLRAVLHANSDAILARVKPAEGAKVTYQHGRFPKVESSDGWTFGFTGRTEFETGYGSSQQRS